MEKFAFKLKRLKADLRTWSKSEVKDLFQEIQDLEDKLIIKERRFKDNTNPKNRSAMSKTQADSNLALSNEEKFWFQKAKSQWISVGVKNTKFYFSQVNQHRRNQWIHSINHEVTLAAIL